MHAIHPCLHSRFGPCLAAGGRRALTPGKTQASGARLQRAQHRAVRVGQQLAGQQRQARHRRARQQRSRGGVGRPRRLQRAHVHHAQAQQEGQAGARLHAASSVPGRCRELQRALCPGQARSPGPRPSQLSGERCQQDSGGCAGSLQQRALAGSQQVRSFHARQAVALFHTVTLSKRTSAWQLLLQECLPSCLQPLEWVVHQLSSTGLQRHNTGLGKKR
jgi:hypothetical protein